MGLSMVSIRPMTRVHGPGLRLIVDEVMISPQQQALARQGDRDVRKTPLVIGTMLGITQFHNGSPSLNEAAEMLGTDSIPRRHGARSCGAYQGFVRELCNVSTSKGL